MSFICPECSSKSLKIIISYDLGDGDWYDERAIQHLRCINCDFITVGFYEEERRGRGERWKHRAFRSPNKMIEKFQVVSRIFPCANRRQAKGKNCTCGLHQVATEVYKYYKKAKISKLFRIEISRS